MRIQPRQELLAIWKSITRWSVTKAGWRWGGEGERNSISDAEQLLCLLLPPTRLDAIRFDRTDATSEDVLAALRRVGDNVEIPQWIVGLITEYLDRYTDPVTGVPVFSGGGYFTAAKIGTEVDVTDAQRALEVVDSYSTSVVLTTTMISFLRDYRQSARQTYQPDVDAAEAAARRRLTAAMVGLQRSFAINVFRADSAEGRTLCRTVSQREGASPGVVAEIRLALRDVIAGLRELGLASDQVTELIERDNMLFECGWSWGVVEDSSPVKTEEMGEFAERGYAEPAPYLYFTVVAVDGIRDLFTGRTRLQGLLNEEQQQLARTLSLQWELARRYWATIASLGGESWPLEDIPWRTTDGDETEYYSLLVTSLVLENLVDRGATDADLARIGSILEELANRGRITRRPSGVDPSLSLHHPGRRIELVGSERVSPEAPRLGWVLADLATLLLGRTLAVVRRVKDPTLRSRLLELVDVTWTHLDARRLTSGDSAGLWDQPASVFPELPVREESPSWYFTTRVVQCLSTAAAMIQDRPSPGPQLSRLGAELLVEAEHAFDEELLRGSAEDAGPALTDSLREQITGLQRARGLLPTRPGTAIALLVGVLRELDGLAAAREREAGE